MSGSRALLALASASVLACQDIVSAPGACPEFCPQGEIRVRDTLLTGVEPVGSFSGYRLPHEAEEAQIVGPGGPVEARALLVFVPFSARYAGGDTTVKDSILQLDSLRVRLTIARRTAGVSGVTLALHEIPLALDSATTYGDMVPYFQDGTLLATLPVPDTLVKDTVAATFPATALRYLGGDSLRVGIGVRISSPEPAFVSLGATPSVAIAARITRFVQVDTVTGGASVVRSDSWGVGFKTFVADPSGLPPPTAVVAGAAAGARAVIKMNLPTSIVDSSLVVRATLLIPSTRPTLGAPGDTFLLRVVALGSDFGPKSPVADTAQYSGSVQVAAGSSDTVAVDITRILSLWRSNTSVPRSVMLRVEPEAASISTIEVPAAGANIQAALRVTYGLPFRLPGS